VISRLMWYRRAIV